MHSRLCSSLEPLEARIAPAGIVKVTVGGGSVKIAGDGEDNDISLSILTPGLLQIVGNGGTLIDFDGLQTPANIVSYTKDLAVSLGDGRDAVDLAAGVYFGNVTFDGGADDNTFTLNGATVVPGTLKLLAKTGSDTLTIDSSGEDFQVGRDFLVKLGDGGVISTLAASRLLVGGKFNLSGGSGVEDFSWTLADDIVVGSDFTLATGKGLDRVALVSGGDIDISGKFSVKGGDSIPPPAPAIVSASLGVTADDEMTVHGAATVTTIAGLAVVNLGGTNSSTFGGGLSIKTGKGLNTVTLRGDDQLYFGKVSVTAGGPTAFVMKPTTFFIGGDFSFKGSAATDSFDLQGTGIITGKASVDLGDGLAQSLTLKGPTAYAITVYGDITLKQGAKTGTSTTTVSALRTVKKFTLTTGGANDTVTIDNLSVAATTTINLGAGGDTFTLETQHVTGDSRFGTTFKLLLGDGADTSTIGDGNPTDRVFLNVANLATPSDTLDAGPGIDIVSDFATLGNVGTLTVLNVP